MKKQLIRLRNKLFALALICAIAPIGTVFILLATDVSRLAELRWLFGGARKLMRDVIRGEKHE